MVPRRVLNYTGPTAFGPNETYLDRAKKIVAAGDLTYRTYFFPWFFDANKGVIQPNDQRWSQVGDVGKTNRYGLPMAWNRRMMVLDGMFKLAAAHETVPLADSALVSLYDSYIKANIDGFMQDLTQVLVVKSNPTRRIQTYDWDYQVSGRCVDFKDQPTDMRAST